MPKGRQYREPVLPSEALQAAEHALNEGSPRDRAAAQRQVRQAQEDIRDLERRHSMVPWLNRELGDAARALRERNR